VIFSVALDSQAQRDIGPLTPAGAVSSEVGTTVPAGDSDFQARQTPSAAPAPGDGGRAGVADSGRYVSMIAVTTRSAARCRQCRRGSKT
jgi:hypothetical protein